MTIDTISLDLDYARAARLLLPSRFSAAASSLTIALIGCGGTGSWLAPSIVRVARLLREKYQKDVSVIFVDPDTVEPKNVYRQNFCEAEIGLNKAVTLAFRYGSAWGVDIAALPQIYKTDLLKNSDLNVIVGCVDNAAARQSIKSGISGKARYFWLDCGNSQSSGQVLLGSASKPPADPFLLPGFCSWLPLPTVRHPELLETVSIETVDPSLSCADMALADSQGLAINQRIAAEAADYLVRMLITHDLRKFATYIDLASGTTKSRYITPDFLSGLETVQ